MAEFVQKEKRRSERKTQEVPVTTVDPEIRERGDEIKSELDELLDEIEDVLADNAEELVSTFIQRGGQ